MVSIGKELKNLGLTTGLGMVARMAAGATPREAIRTAGTTALVGNFIDDEDIANSVSDAVNVLAKQRQVGKTVDAPVRLGYNTAGVEYTTDEYQGAKADLLNLVRQIDFGRYDEIIDSIIDGFVEVKTVIRRLKDEVEHPPVPADDFSVEAKDLL